MLVAAAVRPAAAQTYYDFSALYNGGGSATLASSGQDPTGQNILPLDDFLWTIRATGGSFWRVNTGGSFFPLMAFGVAEAGDRYGDFTLTLLGVPARCTASPRRVRSTATRTWAPTPSSCRRGWNSTK